MDEHNAVTPAEPDRDARQWAMICHFAAALGFVFPFGNLIGPLAVSYTHLTLPTIYSV